MYVRNVETSRFCPFVCMAHLEGHQAGCAAGFRHWRRAARVYLHATHIRNAAITKWKYALTFWEIHLCTRILHAWYHLPGVLNLLAEDCRTDLLLFRGFHAWRRFVRRRQKRDARAVEHDCLRCVRWAVMHWTDNANALREERDLCTIACEHRRQVCLKHAIHALRVNAMYARDFNLTAEVHHTRVSQHTAFKAWRSVVQMAQCLEAFALELAESAGKISQAC